MSLSMLFAAKAKTLMMNKCAFCGERPQQFDAGPCEIGDLSGKVWLPTLAVLIDRHVDWSGTEPAFADQCNALVCWLFSVSSKYRSKE